MKRKSLIAPADCPNVIPMLPVIQPERPLLRSKAWDCVDDGESTIRTNRFPWEPRV